LTGLGIITLGILIALGLEQMIAAHRAKLAAEAVAGFRRELADWDIAGATQALNGGLRCPAGVPRAGTRPAERAVGEGV